MNWGFYSWNIFPGVVFLGRKVNVFIILILVTILLSKKKAVFILLEMY